LLKVATDGVVRAPTAVSCSRPTPPTNTATAELVVPKSIPTARDICESFRKNCSSQNVAFALLEFPTLKLPQVNTSCQINLSESDSTLLLWVTTHFTSPIFRTHSQCDRRYILTSLPPGVQLVL